MKITDINDPKVPQWFRDAKKSYQKWYYNANMDEIVWLKGNWQKGNWQKGTWQDGWWWSSTWQNGTWQDGIWKDGIWKDGTWKDGIWWKGTWQKGIWQDGYWVEGTWQNGTWQKGWIYDPDKIGNYQNNWKWNNKRVESPINPKQYFKDSHMPKQIRNMKNYQKYMNMSDQQLVKLVGFNSIDQWLDYWFQDKFSKQQFIINHKDYLNQSIVKLVRNK